MRMLVPLLVEYACLVQVVDADLPRAVDDLLVAHDDAHMGDVTVLIAEEGQVAGLGLLQEIHQIAFFDLLRGVPGEEQAGHTGADLHHARAVDTHRSAATPKVRCAEQ